LDLNEFNFRGVMPKEPRFFRNERRKQIAPDKSNALEDVITMVRRNGTALQYLLGELKDNPSVVLAAVNENGNALEHASPRLQDDPTVVLAAVRENGEDLIFASPRLQDNPTVVLAAVREYGGALKYASPRLRNDSTIVLAAVSRNGEALKYASVEMKDDEAIVIAALACEVETKTLALEVCQYASPEIRNNIGFMLSEVIPRNPAASRHASLSLWCDPDFFQEAMKQNDDERQYAIGG
jgi:hypothetical protein